MESIDPHQGPESPRHDEYLPQHKESEQGNFDYAQRAQDMHAFITQIKEVSGHWAGIEQAWSDYVTNEPNPIAQQFSEAMLRGAYQIAHEDILNTYGARKRSGEILTEAELDEEWAAKASVIESNHFMRTMLAQQRDNFTTKQVVNWYSKFVGNRFATAEGTVAGALSEIAVYEAAASMPGLLDAVHYGDILDDARGADIRAVSAIDLQDISIDVKAGMQAPEGRIRKTGYQLVIGVPTQLMDAHGRMSDDGRDGLQRLLSLAMQQTAARKQAR